MVPILDDYEYQYKDDGFALNTDVVLPFIDVSRVQGLDSPPYRLTEHVTEGRDGGYIDAEFIDPRTIIVEGMLYTDGNTIEQTMDIIKGNYKPQRQAQPFYFKHPGVAQRVVYCKPIECRFDVDSLRRIGCSPIQLQLKASDPRQYASDPVFAGTQPSSITGGVTFPITWPMSFSGGGSSGIIGIYNYGNIATPAVLTISGPIDQPSVQHIESGKTLTFVTTIDQYHSLIVDTGAHTALLDGTASRRSSMSSTSLWFMLEPGQNTLRFNGQFGMSVENVYSDVYSDVYGSSVPPFLSVEFRSAWL